MMGRSSDFKFWEEKLPIDNHNCGYSTPLWTRTPDDLRQETVSLLPHNHHDQYICLSPASQLRAIVNGRRELMEMIKSMPESSYELSLKDIVDEDQKNVEKEMKVEVADEKRVKHKIENRNPHKVRNTKSSQLGRTQSMESEVFLLKMFIPASLTSKKRKPSIICRAQSSKGPEKQANKDWWKTIFLSANDNQNSTKINRRTSNISSDRTSENKRKPTGQRGCLF